jgi:hypothetical protein
MDKAPRMAARGCRSICARAYDGRIVPSMSASPVSVVIAASFYLPIPIFGALRSTLFMPHRLPPAQYSDLLDQPLESV